MRKLIVFSLFAVFAASLAVTGPVANAALPELDLECHDEVNTSGRLAGPLACPTDEPALTITGSNITLDLAGHSVGGIPSDSSSADIGIKLADGVHDVIIRNGIVSETSTTGIEGLDAVRVTVRDVLLTTTVTGVAITGDGTRVTNITTSGAVSLGVSLAGNDTRVTASAFDGVIAGVQVIGDRTRIVGNTVAGSVAGIILDGRAFTVTKNRVMGSTAGITGTTTGPGTVRFIDNTVYRSLFGMGSAADVDTDPPRMVVRGNRTMTSFGMSFEANPLIAKNNLAVTSTIDSCVPDSVCRPSALPEVELECGDDVTRSMRLEASVTDCPGDGLRIAAPNVVLDLNDKIVDGAGTGTGIKFASEAAGSVVRNGTVQGFDIGVGDSSRPAGVVVRDLFLDENTGADVELSGPLALVRGVWARESATLLVDGPKSRIIGSHVSGTIHNAIRLTGVGSAATGNVVSGGYIEALVDRPVLTGNTVIGGGVLGKPGLATAGHGATITGNNVIGIASCGIEVSGSGKLVLVGNDVHRTAGSAIHLDDHDGPVVQARNLTFANDDDGCEAPGP